MGRAREVKKGQRRRSLGRKRDQQGQTCVSAISSFCQYAAASVGGSQEVSAFKSFNAPCLCEHTHKETLFTC